MAQYGNVFIQDTDPGNAAVAGNEWYALTAGLKYIRNLASNGWVANGTLNDQYDGNMPRTGGTASGAMTGTGAADGTSPNFATSANLGGWALATMADVEALRQTLYSDITTNLTNLTASSRQAALPKDSIAVSSGLAYDYPTNLTSYTVPLPYFDDGIQAIAGQVMAYGVFLPNWALYGDDVRAYQTFNTITSSGNRLFGLFSALIDVTGVGSWTAGPGPFTNNGAAAWGTYKMYLGYFIIATR